MSKDALNLEELLADGAFVLKRLEIDGIDNRPVYELFGSQVSVEENCLFSRQVETGQRYLDWLHDLLSQRMADRQPAPLVRFADGEYAFYAGSLDCNGLYQQAESEAAIRQAIPSHVEKLQRLARQGWLAPLVHQGNIVAASSKGLFSFFRKARGDDSARRFLDFLSVHGVELSADNYLPFYVVYAYFSSPRFAETVNGKHLCILNSTCNLEACRQWFARRGSAPQLSFVKVPGSFVATRWAEIRAGILARIPDDVDLCLVGAGIGALLVCVDVAETFNVPAIDAGHVLNMMNDREDKSNGVRLYTIWKAPA